MKRPIKIRDRTEAKLLTSNSMNLNHKNNSLTEQHFVPVYIQKLLAYCTLRSSGYKQGKLLVVPEDLNEVNWILVIQTNIFAVCTGDFTTKSTLICTIFVAKS